MYWLFTNSLHLFDYKNVFIIIKLSFINNKFYVYLIKKIYKNKVFFLIIVAWDEWHKPATADTDSTTGKFFFEVYKYNKCYLHTTKRQCKI